MGLMPVGAWKLDIASMYWRMERRDDHVLGAQVLTWIEVIEVHWDRIEQKVLPLIDVNADG